MRIYRKISLYDVDSSTKTLTIPEGFTHIAEVSGNFSIRNIVLPKTATHLLRDAFINLEYVTSVTLNEGLLYIGNHSLALPCLRELIVPSTVSYFGWDACNGDGYLDLLDLSRTCITTTGFSSFPRIVKFPKTLSVFFTDDPTRCANIIKSKGDNVHIPRDLLIQRFQNSHGDTIVEANQAEEEIILLEDVAPEIVNCDVTPDSGFMLL